MAAVYITFTGAMGGGAPSLLAISKAAQKITSSGTSQSTTYAAEGGEYARIVASGGSIAVAVGPLPTAASGATGTHWAVDGVPLDLGPLKAGDKIAVIDA